MRVILVIVTAWVSAMARWSSVAQGTLYQLEPGSSFTPMGGSLSSLSGTFEWAAPVSVFDPNTGTYVSHFDATALNFQAGGVTFRLNVSPLNDCDTVLLPGPTGPAFNFCEVVDEFDGAGALVDAGLYLVGQGPGTVNHLVFSGLGLYRSYNSPGSELVGEMDFSAVPIPEPSVSLLIVAAMGCLCWRLRARLGGVMPTAGSNGFHLVLVLALLGGDCIGQTPATPGLKKQEELRRVTVDLSAVLWIQTQMLPLHTNLPGLGGTISRWVQRPTRTRDFHRVIGGW